MDYLNRHGILMYIIENDFFHITHLIDDHKPRIIKFIFTYTYEKSWIDVGQWEEYKNTTKILNDFTA